MTNRKTSHRCEKKMRAGIKQVKQDNKSVMNKIYEHRK